MAEGYALTQGELRARAALDGQSAPSGIQWGSVLRGVAVVTAVVVAAVVGYMAVTGIVGAASNVPWIASAATSIGNAFMFVAEFMAAAASWVWAGIAAGASALWAGISGGAAAPLTAPAAPILTGDELHKAGLVGGGTLAAIAGLKAAPLLADPSTMTAAPAVKTAPIYDSQNMAAQHYAGASSGTHAFKIGHHAVEHIAEQKAKPSFAQRISASRASLASGGINSSAAHANKRNESFIQQLKDDRVALDAALSEPKR